jgi:hypothetical protein
MPNRSALMSFIAYKIKVCDLNEDRKRYISLARHDAPSMGTSTLKVDINGFTSYDSTLVMIPKRYSLETLGKKRLGNQDLDCCCSLCAQRCRIKPLKIWLTPGARVRCKLFPAGRLQHCGSPPMACPLCLTTHTACRSDMPIPS